MRFKRFVNAVAVRLMKVERRLDPYFRDAFDKLVRPPLETAVQWLMRRRLPSSGLALAEERDLPGEAEATASIIELMTAFLRGTYRPGEAQRAGNTKTYGIVRGEFTVLPDLPGHLRAGVFAEPRSYPAWVRFAGPGPLAPPDIDDNGVLSIGIKLMNVEGPKLMDDEHGTQDFTGISCPTFTTPTVIENLKLQKEIGDNSGAWYFLNPRDSHYLDGLMQGLYARVHHSPLEVPYWSCVPYLFGEGRAMKYMVRPLTKRRTPIPRHPAANYLREAMARSLASEPAQFEFCVQFQADADRMPIEHAGVAWRAQDAPFEPVARLTLPVQRFDSPAQLAFADNLSYNPWHSVAEHRPLGNQNRARKAMYQQLASVRQEMNAHPHVEPTGGETFGE